MPLKIGRIPKGKPWSKTVSPAFFRWRLLLVSGRVINGELVLLAILVLQLILQNPRSRESVAAFRSICLEHVEPPVLANHQGTSISESTPWNISQVHKCYGVFLPFFVDSKALHQKNDSKPRHRPSFKNAWNQTPKVAVIL